MSTRFLWILIVYCLFMHNDLMGDQQQGKEIKAPQAHEISLGSREAPHTVMIYFAFNCEHCREFFLNVFPKIITEFRDSGKIRFILHDIPIGPAGFLASKIAHSNGGKRFLDIMPVLLDKQNEWNICDGYSARLRDIALKAGFTPEEFDKCLENKELDDIVISNYSSAVPIITDVPAFIVDGTKFQKELTPEALHSLMLQPSAP